jgi:hypothetical protein
MNSTFGYSRVPNGGRSPATKHAALTLLAFGLCDCGGAFQPTPAIAIDAGQGPPEGGAMVIYIAHAPAPAPDGGLTVPSPSVDAGAPDSWDSGTLADAATAADASALDASDAAPKAVAANCDATQAPKDDACVVADAYAVFVANPVSLDAGSPAGAGGAIGTMADPASTVSQGVALAASSGKSRVYVCGGHYTESVVITSGISLYGGFTCSPGAYGPSWLWAAATTTVSAPSIANAASFVYALSVDSPKAPILIEDMSFASPDAVGQDAKGNGLSSIAAFVNATTVSFVRTALSAGSGASGADGVTGVRAADGTITPSNYQPVGTSYDPSVAPAGTALVPGSITCNYTDSTRLPLAPDSSSGGGPVNPVVPYSSANGTSNPPPVIIASTPAGQYGLGASSSNLPEPGEDGPARPGGAASAAAGTVTASAGWTPAPGGDGPAGQPGQGGGGQHGCEAPDAESGGAGGCGGAGGTGGGAGGSSIALLSVASSVSISGSALRSLNGGNGGAGGDGQVGQAGGPGSTGTCGPAGSGGNGAGGSGGAGGSAGISVGILYSQSELPAFSTMDTSIAVGQPGAQGAGGEPGAGPGAGGSPGQKGYLSQQAAVPYLLAP